MDITNKKFKQEIDNRVVIKIPCCAGKCDKHELPKFIFVEDEKDKEEEQEVEVHNN